jgi:hypothetical protein
MLRNYSDLIDFFLLVRTKNQGCMHDATSFGVWIMYIPPSLVQRGNGNQRIASNKAQADVAGGGFSDDSGNPIGCGEWGQTPDCSCREGR